MHRIDKTDHEGKTTSTTYYLINKITNAESATKQSQPTTQRRLAQLTGGRFNDLPDNERAIHSIMVTWFHWGLHGWIAVSEHTCAL